MASLQSQQLETITKKVDKKVHSAIQKAKARPKRNYTLYLVAKRALNDLKITGVTVNWKLLLSRPLSDVIKLQTHEDLSIPGHVFIGGKKTDGSLEAYGFYPGKDNSIYEILTYDKNNKQKGKIDADDIKYFHRALAGDKSYQYIEFKVTSDIYAKAIDFIKNYDSHNDYGLFENSCVHAAFKTMNHVGLIKSQGYPKGALPQVIYDHIPVMKKVLGKK